MIQRQLKLRLTSRQERQLTQWLWHLTGVWNWAIRKLELDARDGLYSPPKGFHNLLANHGKTLGIPALAHGVVGIDPGFRHLLTLSNEEKVLHPRELQRTAQRLAQAQRGKRKALAARVQERLADQRKDRNHKLSRRLVAENQRLVWSKDRYTALAKSFGKRVTSLGTRNFEACCPTSALQAVGSSSKFPPSTPPRPAQHVGASPVPLATQACRSGSGCAQRMGLLMTAM